MVGPVGCRVPVNQLYNYVAQFRTVRTRPLLRPCQKIEVARLRCFSRETSSGDGADDGIPKRGDKRSGVDRRQRRDPAEAKAKLNDLLQSILKEQDKRNSLPEEEKQPGKIDFKLARKPKVKPSPPTEKEVQAAEEQKATEKEIGKEMLSAVKTVATTVEGDPKEIETELVQKLKSHAPTKVNLSDLVEGMKIDKTRAPPSRSQQDPDHDLSRAGRVRKVLGDRVEGRPERRQGFTARQGRTSEDISGLSYRPIDLFGARPLGIFTKAKSKTAESDKAVPTSYLKTWDALHQKELKLAVMHPPANGFEEMILWTEQGKLWQFPINNEQGLNEEAKFSFADHVFLEPHIDDWCPKKGPIRHFMELVCVGLSKNPWLTVQEKKDHLDWYHEYFRNKSDIIKEVGAGEIK